MSAARAYVRRYRWTWPSIQDPKRKLANKLAVLGHPAVVLIDAKGYIVGVHIGAGGPETWRSLAAKL